MSELWSAWSRIQTTAFVRRLNFDVLEENRAAGFHNFASFDAAKNTIDETHIVNYGAWKTGEPHHSRARHALNIFESDVAHDRFVRSVRPRLVQKVDGQDGF